MQEKIPYNQINDLDDAGFKERVTRFKESADGILADNKHERSLNQPISAEEAEAAVVLLEEAGPLAPPIPKKSTPEGRAFLETLTSRRPDSIHQ